MIKRTFYSTLFEKEIKDSDKDYVSFVKAEVLFRIRDMKEKNCSCFKCKTDLEKLVRYYDKHFLDKEENF